MNVETLIEKLKEIVKANKRTSCVTEKEIEGKTDEAN